VIRRDVLLADGRPGWLLIEQPAHARLSRWLAERCAVPVGGGLAPSDARAFRDDVLSAIERHDDGWRTWESCPAIEAAAQRPLSFNELPAEDAVAIWTGSMAAGRAASLLGGWMVASHFLRLLDQSESLRDDPRAQAWRNVAESQREVWRRQWLSEQPAWRTAALAEEAVAWLWALDAASLWLCLHCPLPGTSGATPPWEVGADGPLHAVWDVRRAASGAALPAAPTAFVTADPWLFGPDELTCGSPALRVPAGQYADGRALLAAGEPVRLAWRLSPARPGA
jgi:hypothetical protein